MILVDPSLVFITIYFICLIYAPVQTRREETLHFNDMATPWHKSCLGVEQRNFKEIMHFTLWLTWPRHSTWTSAPGVKKYTILVNPSLDFITLYTWLELKYTILVKPSLVIITICFVFLNRVPWVEKDFFGAKFGWNWSSGCGEEDLWNLSRYFHYFEIISPYLSIFSPSSPEPLGQFQPNLTQSILVWREFKFVQMKSPTLFQGEIITK